MFDTWAETITSLQLLHLHMSTHTVYMSIIIHDQGQSVTKVGTMSLTMGCEQRAMLQVLTQTTWCFIVFNKVILLFQYS